MTQRDGGDPAHHSVRPVTVIAQYACNSWAVPRGGPAADADTKYMQHVKLRGLRARYAGARMPTLRVSSAGKS